jgi:2-iminobutanoate/2-iminopropanoate deaminase
VKRARPLSIVHHPDRRTDVMMPYAPGILVHGGRLVFLSGVTAAAVYHSHPHRDEEFDLPPTMHEQAVLTMENLRKTLAAAGCTFADLVSATRFLTDVGEQDDLNRVWAKYLDGHLPTTTTVEVSRLATHARCKIEIAAVAVRGEPRAAASRAKSMEGLRGEPRAAASRAKDKKKKKKLQATRQRSAGRKRGR